MTRCPVRLVMRSAPEWSCSVSTTSSTQTITPKSPDDLTAIILRLTETLTQGQKELSSDAIIIRLSSPESPDLTVIDLPGIVRTETSERGVRVIHINNLIPLREDRTIILAIIPANQDIATIDILERARIVDPAGERTIGVLTKPDLIGPGNEQEVVAVLRNIRKPLKLGFVMVKNRSQAQVEEGLSCQTVTDDEETFFQNHPNFSCLDQGSWKQELASS